MPSRRTVVRAVGAGLVGTVGLTYWQRRRILRQEDVASMEAAIEVEIPTFDYGAAVSDDHLEASYERAVEAFEEADEELGEDETYGNWVDRRQVPEAIPSELADAPSSDRRDALSEYRGRISSLYNGVGGYRYEVDLIDEEDVVDRVAEERTALESVEYDHRGGTITEAIVDGAFVDDRYRLAANNLDTAEDRTFTDASDFRIAWGRVGSAFAERHDAEQFARGLEGDDHGERMAVAVETLTEAIETDQEAIEWEHDEADANYAESIVLSRRLYRSRTDSIETRSEDGYVASALVFSSRWYTTLGMLEAFADVPSYREWEELGWTVDSDDLPELKREAVAAVAHVLEEYGDDPLVRLLLAEAVDVLEQGDGRLEGGTERANEDDDTNWERRLNSAAMEYLEAKEFAIQIPDTIALITAAEA